MATTNLKALTLVSIAALALTASAGAFPGHAQGRKVAAVTAAPSGPRLKLRIAVNQGKWEALRYENYTIDRDVVRALQAKIIEKLQSTGMFEVMEREATSVEQADQETLLAEAKNLDHQSKGPEQRPKGEVAIPADYIINPEIVGFNITGRGKTKINPRGVLGGLGGIVKFGQISTGETKTTAEINLRIFSSETRSILDVASGKGEAKKRDFKIDASVFGAGLGQERFAESSGGPGS